MTFRNTEGTESIKNFVTEKVTHTLQKFVHHDTDVHVVLTVEKNCQIAEISFNTDGNYFVSKEETKDLYTSIDSAINTLSGQLRKHKEKLTNKHK
ncbi:MAG: ribosome-associated translation inhibitor RaiA [bacterium]|nr:ribosome-associated translation inhibitor RaiA [bacterium]